MKAMAKNILPKRISYFYRRKKENFIYKILKIASQNRLMASIYYIFSKDFDREHMSVISGKINYFEDLNEKKSSYLLRRNIHRLEKGLLMKPRRKVFALGYIEETVICYRELINNYNIGRKVSTSELSWANDVLQLYFQVTDSTPFLNKLEEKFFDAPKVEIERIGSSQYIPYKKTIANYHSVSTDKLLELAKARRSVRWFLQEEVPRGVIDEAIEIAKLSPSACNRQPFEFRVFDDPDLVKTIGSFPMGTQGYNENIPVIVAMVGKLNAYPYERDRHLIYIDSSLAAMSFLYALETQGVGSCIINWPDIETKEKQISNFLNLREDERVTMLIGLGYPDPEGKVAYSKKKDLEEIRFYNI